MAFFAYWWYLIAQEMEYGVASHAALLAVVLQASQRSRLPLVPPSLPSIQVGLVSKLLLCMTLLKVGHVHHSSHKLLLCCLFNAVISSHETALNLPIPY